MRRALTCLPLALLFIANVVPTKAQTDPGTTVAPTTSIPLQPVVVPAPAVDGSPAPGAIQYYDVNRNTSFTCTITPGAGTFSWQKNNTDISKVSEMTNRYKLEENNARLVIQRTNEEDYGNYSCKLGNEELFWQLHARPYAKLPSTDTSVVEGQKLKLTCRLVGKPLVPVEWLYNKEHTSYDPEETNYGDKVEANDRIKLEKSDAGVENGQLVIEAAERSDAGAYTCRALAEPDARSPHPPAVTVLRVKDMYAALWPFLGICAEVLVLCAIILVYEKRRTKPEMEDSDTDNHDQKKS